MASVGFNNVLLLGMMCFASANVTRKAANTLTCRGNGDIAVPSLFLRRGVAETAEVAPRTLPRGFPKIPRVQRQDAAGLELSCNYECTINLCYNVLLEAYHGLGVAIFFFFRLLALRRSSSLHRKAFLLFIFFTKMMNNEQPPRPRT